MPTVEYAPRPRFHQRRRWILILTILPLLFTYVYALPWCRRFQERQYRRTEIRRRFASELEAAKASLAQNDVSLAAVSLLRAEFPIRTEADLFGPEESNRFCNRLAIVREELNDLCAQARAEEARAKSHTAQLPSTPTDRITTIVCNFSGAEASYRLHSQVPALVAAGDMKGALTVCENVVAISPTIRVDGILWRVPATRR